MRNYNKFALDLFKTVQQEYDDKGVPGRTSFPTMPCSNLEGRMGIIDVLNEEGATRYERFVSKLTTCIVPSRLHLPHKMNKDQFTIDTRRGCAARRTTGSKEHGCPGDLAGVAEAVHSRCSPSYFLRQ